ncbi:kinase-like domain-containing protein, partial [Podospora australis]
CGATAGPPFPCGLPCGCANGLSVGTPHRDLELETIIRADHTRHIFYRRGHTAAARRIKLAEKWIRAQRLGRGAFGSVWLEQCESPVREGTPPVRAVKEVKVDPSVDVTRELEAIVEFSHNRYEPCFVQCLGWYRHAESIFIAMEYIRHGDLKQYLSEPLPESEARIITRQVLDGLMHMHTNQFVHRDLKPENILVLSTGPEWLVQISDFGISRRLEEGKTMQGTMRQGTLGYIAPELKGFVAEKGFPLAVDMWSLGALAFRMFAGRQFLTGVDDLREFVMDNTPFPSQELLSKGLSEVGTDFLQKLLLADPVSRLTASSADSHSWMRSSVNEETAETGYPDDSDSDPETSQAKPKGPDTNLQSTMRSQRSQASAHWTWRSTNRSHMVDRSHDPSSGENPMTAMVIVEKPGEAMATSHLKRPPVTEAVIEPLQHLHTDYQTLASSSMPELSTKSPEITLKQPARVTTAIHDADDEASES